MHTVVLLRHGESDWNRENRFTRWTDVDLSERGVREAHEAARLLREGGYITFDLAYTSVLKRAIRTLGIVLDDMDLMWIPVHRHWRLNERHYGALQGLNKAETAERHGDDQVKIWRRSYDTPPPSRRTTIAIRAAIRAMRGSRPRSCRSPNRSRIRLPGSCRTGPAPSRRSSGRDSAC